MMEWMDIRVYEYICTYTGRGKSDMNTKYFQGNKLENDDLED